MVKLSLGSVPVMSVEFHAWAGSLPDHSKPTSRRTVIDNERKRPRMTSPELGMRPVTGQKASGVWSL
jgi:hypothetical protein